MRYFKSISDTSIYKVIKLYPDNRIAGWSDYNNRWTFPLWNGERKENGHVIKNYKYDPMSFEDKELYEELTEAEAFLEIL